MDVDDALSFSRKKFAEDKPNIFENASKLTNAGLNKPNLSTKIKLDAFVAVTFVAVVVASFPTDRCEAIFTNRKRNFCSTLLPQNGSLFASLAFRDALMHKKQSPQPLLFQEYAHSRLHSMFVTSSLANNITLSRFISFERVATKKMRVRVRSKPRVDLGEI